MSTVTAIPAQPDPGTRLAYRADGRVRTGRVQGYQQGTGCSFPVADDQPPCQWRMLLASECVPAEQADQLRES